MRKATVNYWIDVVIGIAFVGSALSGLVFLLPGDPTTGVLGMSYVVWNDLHTWSSLALIAGVGGHLVLHWRWMVAMTGRMLPVRGRGKALAPGLACSEARGTTMSRRAFLALGGMTALAAGLGVVGYNALAYTSTAQASGVACPRGLVNDPYPGRCRLYVDSNGDGICDYSVPGSQGAFSTSGFPAVDGGGGRRRRGS